MNCPDCGAAMYYEAFSSVGPVWACQCCHTAVKVEAVTASTSNAGPPVVTADAPEPPNGRSRRGKAWRGPERAEYGRRGGEERAKRPGPCVLPCPTEHDEQCALMIWSELNTTTYPELRLLHAIPNAGAGAQSGLAGWLKAEGVKPGVPDLFLPVARGGFHGIYVELKRVRGGHLSDEQAQWAIWLTNEGYLVVTRKGWQAASEAIIEYLEMK